MEKQRNTLKDTLVVGFALFAVFFGAGNLVFPPQIGLMCGENLLPGMLGMVFSGILFPMLAVAAVGNVGNGLEDLSAHVHPALAVFFMVVGCGGVCFGTIPRCGAVAYEIGLGGIFGEMPDWVHIVFLLVFFGVSWLLASSRSQVMDNIGKFITPILLVALLVIIVLAVVNPLGAPTGGYTASPFSYALLTTVNTGDVGTGIMCAGIFITTLNAKGYRPGGEQKRMTYRIIVVAFILLFVVYGGLCYLGATGGYMFSKDTENTTLLVGLVRNLAGYTGIVVLSIAIIAATFTTAAGMIATAGDWLVTLSGKRIPYKISTLILTVVIAVVASAGVSFVIKLAGPLFMMTFSLCIIMTFLGLFKRFFNDGVWKGAVIMALIIGFYDAFTVANTSGLINIKIAVLDNLYAAIPGSSSGLACLLPSLIGGLIGGVIWKVQKRESVVDQLDLIIAEEKKNAGV